MVKKRKKEARRPPHRTPAPYLGAVALAATGWALGYAGPLWWFVAAVFAAAATGIWYPRELRRVVDQYRNVARQVATSWTGQDRIPVSEVGAFLLVALWCTLLGMGMGRYPRPELVSAAEGALFAVLGMLLRAGVVAWRTGCPWLPPDKATLDGADKAVRAGGRDRSRMFRWSVIFVALQSALGVVLLGGVFLPESFDRNVGYWLGSFLLGASGLELVLLVFRYRLEPIQDRLAAMRRLAEELDS